MPPFYIQLVYPHRRLRSTLLRFASRAAPTITRTSRVQFWGIGTQDRLFFVGNMLTKNCQRIGTLPSSFPFVQCPQFPLQVNLLTYIDSHLCSRSRIQFTSPVSYGDINGLNQSIRLHKAIQVQCCRFLHRASLMVGAFIRATLK
jgi:hypothetical protein